MMGQSESQNKNDQKKLFLQQPQSQQIPFVRIQPESDIQWRNIGRYFCLILVVLAFALLSTSVETTTASAPAPRILTEVKNQCKEPNICFPDEKYEGKQQQSLNKQTWPFKSGTGEPIQQCRNNYWQHYLQNAKKQLAHPYDQNLLTCNNPSLVHIESFYDKTVEGKWTFLITNPTVSNIFISENGQHSLKDVSYLEGVYQLMAQRVVLTRLIGKNDMTFLK